MPARWEYLWGWFHELSSARGGGGFGMAPIAWSEMLAWQQVTGRTLTRIEWQTIQRLDRLLMAANAPEPPKKPQIQIAR